MAISKRGVGKLEKKDISIHQAFSLPLDMTKRKESESKEHEQTRGINQNVCRRIQCIQYEENVSTAAF